MDSTASVSATTRLEPFLLEIADVVNTTLDLDTLLSRVAELVRKFIDYEIFSILLLNERTQEMRIRFAVGHPQEVIDRARIKVGEGITGLAALKREPVLINDVSNEAQYINAISRVRSELAIPLIVRNKVIGVIDIEAPVANYFTEDHRNVLWLIASRMAVGIQNAQLYTRVSRQAKSLMLLNEISRDLTSILNLDQLLNRIGELLKRIIDYQMFSVLLLDPTGTKLQHRFSLRYNETVKIKHDIPVGEGLVGFAVRYKEPVVVADVEKDPRYINTNPETRSELCVPLIYKDNVIGVLDVEHTRRGYFVEQHVRTITTLAGQIAIAIENARLYETLSRQEQQLERDLALARELQFRLLPPCCPVLKNAELAAKFAPAHAIGGDLFDFVPYVDQKGNATQWGIGIGDVSGKGAPAALYAALVSGFLRSHAAAHPGAADMLTLLNRSLIARPIDAQYLAMTYVIWDDEHRQARIANSGLPRAVYCHNGKVQKVEAAGLPAGMFPNPEYDEVTFNASEGDVFIFFTDGITDATNAQGHMFGRAHVEQLVAAHCGQTADEIVTAIFQSAAQYTAGAEPFDDQTIVAIKVRRAVPSKPTKN